MKIKRIIIYIVLTPVLLVVLNIIGYCSFSLFDNWQSNPRKEVTKRLSNDRYEILVYQDKEKDKQEEKEISPLPISFIVTFIDNNESTPLEHRLLNVFDENFSNVYFIDSCNIAIIMENINNKESINLIQIDTPATDLSKYDKITNLIKLDTLTFDLSKYEKIKWY